MIALNGPGGLRLQIAAAHLSASTRRRTADEGTAFEPMVGWSIGDRRLTILGSEYTVSDRFPVDDSSSVPFS